MYFGSLTNVFLTEWSGNCSAVFQIGCTSSHVHSKIWEDFCSIWESVLLALDRGGGVDSARVSTKGLASRAPLSQKQQTPSRNGTKDVNGHFTMSNSLSSCPVISIWKGPQVHYSSGKCRLKLQEQYHFIAVGNERKEIPSVGKDVEQRELIKNWWKNSGINCYGKFEDAYILRPRNFRFISHGNGCLHRTEYMFKSTYNM